MQCIDAPTYNKGKTLDILLTKSKQYITDLRIIDTERYCISDHFAITFKIKQSVIRKPRVKCTCFNYRDTHWIDLNNDLNNINWDMIIDCYEPEIMWSNFKTSIGAKSSFSRPAVVKVVENLSCLFICSCVARVSATRGGS